MSGSSERTSSIGPGDQPQAFLFGERQHFGGVDPAGANPIVHLAAIAFDGRPNERRDEVQHALEIVLEEVEPVGQGVRIEHQQRPGEDLQPVDPAPFDLLVAGGPGKMAFRGFHVAPGRWALRRR